MTSVLPDLPLPGAAAKKPQAGASPDSQAGASAPSDGASFAETLEAATGDTGGDRKPEVTTPTTQDTAPAEASAPGATIDMAELQLFNQTALASDVAAAQDPETVAVPDAAAVGQPGTLELGGTGTAPVAEVVVPVAVPVTSPTLASVTPATIEAGFADAPVTGLDENTSGNEDAVVAAPPVPVVQPAVPDLGAGITLDIHPDETVGTAENASGLHVPGTTGTAPPGLTSAAPTLANPQASTPINQSTQGGGLQQLAAGLTLDPRVDPAALGDGHDQSGLQNDNKTALRATAALTPETKPSDGGASQSFSTTLSAASTDAATQKTREAAAANTPRPSRPAQAAPATAQIAVHIVRAVADGVSRFTVQLQPAELGRVEVKMEVGRDGTVRAMVTADRQETV
ncbi:MAG: flagellar hook-length control protein FliK, partial [Alphaproteobacteria bacterium]|nr:flagellar hook-length control protein FliK [Alphaproteobacteria bacterium]